MAEGASCTELYRLVCSASCTELYRVVCSCTELCAVVQSCVQCELYRVVCSASCTELYRVVQSCTEVCAVVQSCTELCAVVQSCVQYVGLWRVVLQLFVQTYYRLLQHFGTSITNANSTHSVKSSGLNAKAKFRCTKLCNQPTPSCVQPHYTYACTYTHTQEHAQNYTYTYACTYTHTHTSTHNHTHTYTLMQNHTHT